MLLTLQGRNMIVNVHTTNPTEIQATEIAEVLDEAGYSVDLVNVRDFGTDEITDIWRAGP
jgi:hypothetical protein